MLVALTACGPIPYEHNSTIKTSYKEWVNEIGLFSHKNLKVSRYDEENNRITILLKFENGLTGYKELYDVVDAHNKFVDANPDYFPNDIEIVFSNGYTNAIPSSFYNKDLLYDVGLLGRPDTAKFQYMLINMEGADAEILKNSDVVTDIPVIRLKCWNNQYTPKALAYEFLSEFKNTEQVILDYWEPGYDKDEVCRSIREYLPNVEIYAVEDKHLVKCQ